MQRLVAGKKHSLNSSHTWIYTASSPLVIISFSILGTSSRAPTPVRSLVLRRLVLVAIWNLLHLPDHLVKLLLLIAALLSHHFNGFLSTGYMIAVRMQEEFTDVVAVGDHLWTKTGFCSGCGRLGYDVGTGVEEWGWLWGAFSDTIQQNKLLVRDAWMEWDPPKIHDWLFTWLHSSCGSDLEQVLWHFGGVAWVEGTFHKDFS